MPLQSSASTCAAPTRSAAAPNRIPPCLRIDTPFEAHNRLSPTPLRVAKDQLCEIDYLSPLDAPLIEQSIQNCDNASRFGKYFEGASVTPIAQSIARERAARGTPQALARL